MFPLIMLVTPILPYLFGAVKVVTDTVTGDITSDGLKAVKEALGIQNHEKIMESGLKHLEGQAGNIQSTLLQQGQLIESGFKNIGGQLGTIQTALLQQGEVLSNVQLGMTHQATMLAGIQSSIGALGMTAAAGCALSAVNLYQLLKIRKSLDKIEQKVDNGFLDLKVFFSERLQDLLNEQQRQRLVQAYIYYRKGIEQLQSSVLIEDPVNRKLAVSNAISIFTQSFAVYDNKEEYATINAPAKLRRLECCWAIQSSIAEAYCLQNEFRAALDCYKKLKERIHVETQSLKVEMNPANFRFIINDLNWIYRNDIALINNKIDLLESNCRQPQSALINIQFPEKTEDFFQGCYLPTAKLYLDYLVSPQKLFNIKLAVLFARRIERPSALSDVDCCRLYTEEVIDQDEYKTAYLESEQISVKFVHLVEEHFLKKYSLLLSSGHFFEKELAHVAEPWIIEDSYLIRLHKLSGSLNPLYEDIHYFNYAVKSYFMAVVRYIRDFSQAKSKERDSEKQRLSRISEMLGLSKHFSSAIDKVLADYAQKRKPDYLKTHRDKAVSIYLHCKNVEFSSEVEQTLSEYEKTTLLTKEEIQKNRVVALDYFVYKKNELLNQYPNPIHNINPDNDVLIWDVQDAFSIKREEAKLFVKNCQLGVEQYVEALKTLSKSKLLDQSRAFLKDIQNTHGFCDKFVAKITEYQRVN